MFNPSFNDGSGRIPAKCKVCLKIWCGFCQEKKYCGICLIFNNPDHLPCCCPYGESGEFMVFHLTGRNSASLILADWFKPSGKNNAMGAATYFAFERDQTFVKTPHSGVMFKVKIRPRRVMLLDFASGDDGTPPFDWESYVRGYGFDNAMMKGKTTGLRGLEIAIYDPKRDVKMILDCYKAVHIAGNRGRCYPERKHPDFIGPIII